MRKLLPTVVFAALVAACSSGPPPPPPPPPWTPAGTYDLSIDAMGMQLGGVMTITEVNGEFSGVLGTEMGDVALSDFVVDGHELTFTGDSPDFSLAFMVIIEDGELSGQFDMGGMGSGSMVGTLREGSLP
jgi:hypothetical protein